MLNVLNSINIAAPGATILTTRIVPQFLKVFEPELIFWRFSEAPIDERDYSSVTWNKPQRLEVTPAAALLSPGITPVSTNVVLDSIQSTAKQYGIYATLSDELINRMQNRNLPGVISELLAANMARIVDRVVQDAVLDNAVNRFYAAATPGGVRAANRAALTSSDRIFSQDLIEAHRRLQAAPNYAPYLEGDAYVALMPTNVYSFLEGETNTGSFIDVAKYKTPEKIVKGEIGKLFNIRLVVSPFIKTYQSTIKVYPTLFIGMQAYGATQLQAMQIIMHGLGSGGTEDPLDQRMTVGVKTFFSSIILQQASCLVFESAGADS